MRGTAWTGWTKSARLRRWAPRVAGTLGLLIAGYLGGVSVTSILPTDVQTQHYSAEARLSALPTRVSTLHSPTALGDIDLEFRGFVPAPGIDATVQVKENVTNLFDNRQVSLDALEPTQAEIGHALRTAVIEVGLKFLAGVVAVEALALALIALGRRGRPRRVSVVAATVAGACAFVGPVLAAAQTYRPDNLTTFRTTSLLGTVRRNAGLLTDVRARAQEATPYVQNLLALSQALQEKFVPQELNQAAAARLLLVSDIHGANQYPIMQRIVQDEGITAIIDCGDLLNFGSVTEAEAAGIFDAIGKLGVPYIFVRGNHDASSPTDQSLLQRMAKIPNVILLEPKPSTYTEVSVDGVTIGGFNDPRFFGDDNHDNAAKQKPAADAFTRAYEGHTLPDIVVSHEPAAVEDVKSAGVRINGHMHKRGLEGNRIQVGTFTGGGTVSHFIAGASADESDNGELEGQPYAFDIAVFGDACGLTSLTRYTYRNLIQGRPAYDDVSVINGKTITLPPKEGRVCRPTLGVTHWDVAKGRSRPSPTTSVSERPPTTITTPPTTTPTPTIPGKGGAPSPVQTQPGPSSTSAG
jgi:predicted phosphodiesterase